MADGSQNAVSYGAVLWRRRIPIAIVLAIGFAVAFAMLHHTQYQATATVMQVGEQGDKANSSSIDLPTLLLSSSVAGQVHRTMNAAISTDEFNHAIDGKTSPGSSVLTITYQDADRERSVVTANALADRMAVFYRELGYGRLNALDTYLKDKLAAQEREIAGIDRRLAEAVVAHPGAAGKDVVNSAASRVTDLEAQRGALQSRLLGDDARLASQSQHLAALSATVHYELEQSDPLLHELQQHVASDTANALTVTTAYRSDFAGVKSVNAQLRRERQTIETRRLALANLPAGASLSYRQSEIAVSDSRASDDADRAQLASLDRQIAEARGAMYVLPKLNYTIYTLETRRDADVSAYQALATKRSTVVADQAQNSSVGSVVVVDRAVTADAILVGGHAIRLVGALLSVVVLAIGLALLLEALDTRMRDGGAIERIYGRPYLGEMS